jgi:energy-coupling factor transporter ATP-binding protein EcfA2
VACERAAELSDDPVAGGRQEGEARDLIDLGHRFAWRARDPELIVVCGVSASGKTTLAERLAAVSGRPHLSSDLTRKLLAGVAPTARGDAGLYTAAAREAAAASRRGEGAIVDATFHREAERFAFEEGMGGGTLGPLAPAPSHRHRTRPAARRGRVLHRPPYAGVSKASSSPYSANRTAPR